ncbi:MAG: hypothetical protein HKO56_05390, partial [Bacteroidia bacterium]|nr:hypothetical protein [Bacteroidia bacterium]NNM16072.1 hypothetical protein [Bacteroidia bacterium]
MVYKYGMQFLLLFLGVFIFQSSNAAINDTPCDATLLTVGCGAKNTLSNSGLIGSAVPTPLCGNYVSGDIWVSVLVPSSGEIDIQTKSLSLTDIAMAVYRETSNCSSTITFIACDDNSGNGNMPRYILTGETPGTKIYIRLWDKFNDEVGDFDLELSEPSDIYCLMSDAVMFNFPVDTCVQLTAASVNQHGCAWYKHTVDFSQNFDNIFTVYFGNDDNGADGMTFTFHNDPQGNVECGIVGQQLGAGGIQNSVSIEFDSFYNFHSSELWPDHISVWTSLNGHLNPIAGPVQANANTVNIEDATPHNVRLSWDAASTTLRIYFDFDLRLTVTYDFVANVFGSKNVFWGSTGSTGASYNLQVVCLPIAFSPL